MTERRTREACAGSAASEQGWRQRGAAFALRLLRAESAQDALEYLLVVGGVTAVLVAGLLAFDAVVAQLVGHVCPSVDTANPLAAIGECIT